MTNQRKFINSMNLVFLHLHRAKGKAKKRYANLYQKYLDSAAYKYQREIDHYEFMNRHEKYFYNCFTAHLVG